ncbi:Deneddylase [Talaromyces islandicus]|uniref:Deneddylase n=1 Tax=Talaromyces islandicus TaxID=28573 RepID=A0A0U1MCQ6_TALIS|nr:Deneddylase [Talaromyces islandicus]
MKARGIPEKLLRWIEAFCSERTATILINGHTSEVRSLPQAGLPQGSPLSPILFLFFNADLVQRQIDSQGGAIAFVDDFTAWVTGPTAQSNREGIDAIINEALEWERRGGATFEAGKTAIIHFTPKAYKSEQKPFTIKGQTIEPKDHVKILGVIMDTRLKYKEHIARAASKGLEAAMELKRLRGLSPATARQLFTSTVTPVVDYASNVWMHAFKDKAVRPINRVQRIGAQAIVGTFLTVATSVAEAEAHIATAQSRFWRRAVKIWTDIPHLARNEPTSQEYRSDQEIQKIPPITVVSGCRRAEGYRNGNTGNHQPIHISTMGGANADRDSGNLRSTDRNRWINADREQNPYSGELAAMAHALGKLQGLKLYRITLLTSNKAAALTLRNPRQQSGQEHVCQIYKSIKRLRRNGNQITIRWIPTSEDNKLLGLAKEQARAATQKDAIPCAEPPRMKSTTLNIARSQVGTNKALPGKVGKHAKRVDAALPGKHTRQLYDPLSWNEASVLAQLRTGMARLNGYLYRINAAETDQHAGNMSGLEAVGIVSSIVQIADLGARVALKLCTFCHQVKQAESNIQNLSKDVSLTCSVLRQLGENMRRDDQILLYSQNAFETAQEILDECDRVFREIESAMDRDLSTFASTEFKNPFLKLSRKLNFVLKEPHLNLLRTNLDRLKDTMLLMLNVIIYMSQLRRRETETSKADQKELLKTLDRQRRKLDDSSAIVQRAVAVSPVGVFSNVPAVDPSAKDASPALYARLPELSLLPDVPDDQLNLISLEVEKYSGFIKDILERIQAAGSLLAANRHGRIKRMVLDAHATEIRMFTVDYGEKAGELCAKLCQGSLFDQVPGAILAATAEFTDDDRVTEASEKRTKKKQKQKRRGARLQEERTEEVVEQLIAFIHAENGVAPIPDVKTEQGQLDKDMASMGEEHRRVMTSLLDPNRADIELYNNTSVSEEGEPASADNVFDLKGLLSTWTTLTADELIMI